MIRVKNEMILANNIRSSCYFFFFIIFFQVGTLFSCELTVAVIFLNYSSLSTFNETGVGKGKEL